MANEIVKMVANKANLSEPIAQIAVDTVLTFLKGKLPPVVGTTLDSFLSSSSAKSTKTAPKSDSPLGDLGSIAGTIGSLLGKK